MGKKVNVWLNELESWCSQATEDVSSVVLNDSSNQTVSIA